MNQGHALVRAAEEATVSAIRYRLASMGPAARASGRRPAGLPDGANV